jgi:predicted outer membrane protein
LSSTSRSRGRSAAGSGSRRVGGVPNPTPTYDTLRRPAGDRTTRDETNARNERNELPPLRREDRAFVAGVLSDHLLHVRLARIAQRDAKMSDTRRFAERVETELTRWGGRWQRFSDRRDANVTSRLEQQDRAKLERLRNAQEKNFDHAYAAIVANHMERMLDRFRTERWDERPGPVGRLAQDEIPVLRDLHARARVLEKQAGDRDEDSNNK